MPYYTGDVVGYRGDYYRGDYYRGDPGLFSFFGKALGGIAKLGTSVVRAGLGLQAPVQFPQISPPQTGLINIGGFGPQRGLVNIGGGQPGVPAVPLLPQIMGGACLRGTRLNRSRYVTRGGGTSRWPVGLQLHEKQSTCVKVRRMNVANARALRRAIRRVSGFGKLVKRARGAISRAASAVGVHRGRGRKGAARGAPSVRIVKAA